MLSFIKMYGFWRGIFTWALFQPWFPSKLFKRFLHWKYGPPTVPD